MKTFNKSLIAFSTVFALTACDSDDKIGEIINDSAEEGKVYGPYSTGSVSEPSFVYFDLETLSEVSLTEEEAATNTVWDVAFKRSGIYLNAANSEAPVSAFFTGNNADFIDSEGKPVVDSFINATPESELDDFTAVTTADIPAEADMFVADVTSNIIASWYNYNATTHQVSAAEDKYFVVYSDDTLSKFSVSGFTQAGFALSDITITYANQTVADTEFASTTTDVTVNASEACSAYDAVYIDFDLGQTVAETDAWDITLACNTDKTGISFGIDIAADSTAMQDFENAYTGVAVESISYYDFQENEYTVKAFDANPWYKYGVNGGHTLWSQYGVYLIQTETATYKLQMTSYYDAEGTSGSVSFRAEALQFRSYIILNKLNTERYAK